MAALLYKMVTGHTTQCIETKLSQRFKVLAEMALNQRLEGIAHMTCHNDRSYFRKSSRDKTGKLP
ncbi:MAG: hypothetical protein CMN90_02350 [Sutterellaceae bacterium]|nr:hypothetical protein LMED105_05507 [Limnobacter sp. MED105]MAZ08494.1 hypothetical protein [Sutterellaceae bacterium]